MVSPLKCYIFYVNKPVRLVSLLRNTGKSNIVPSSSKRPIMTTKVYQTLEKLKVNPYFEKYAEKIAKLQETNPEEFLKRVESKEKEKQEKKERQMKERKFEQATSAKSQLTPGIQHQESSLNKIMKVDLIRDKSKEEITYIWHEYHKQKDCISAVMTSEQYDKMFEAGKKYPTFLLPLPRERGYEFIVLQFCGSEVHMTPLLWYQTHKENAPECLTLYHYTDLKENKDMVLMRGEFDTKLLNVQEAQCLVNELQLYYTSGNEARQKLLETFTTKPDEFKHADLLKQVESITLDSSLSQSLKKSA